MSIIDQSRLKTLNPSLKVGDLAVTDVQLLGAARNYKKYVASRYRLYGEKDIKYFEGELKVSPKIDGQLHYLLVQGDDCFLFNIKGRVITEVPLLAEAKAKLGEFDQILLAGELYCQNEDGARPRVYDVTSALGADSTEKDAERLAFAVFDVVQINGENCRQMTFDDKEALIKKYVPDAGKFHYVDWKTADKDAISDLYNRLVVAEGEEGLVCIDDAHQTIYKLKPRHNVDAVILGFTESPDNPDSLRVLLVGLMRPDNTFQLFAKVGTGFDDDERREFYRTLKPMAVDSTFNITDRNHTCFTMVRPEIIIEMAFHDLIYENASGRPEMKAVLDYSPETGYTTRLAEPFVSVLGPVFKRIREDKEVNTSDLRLTQIADFVDLGNLEAKSRSLDFAASDILQREVYTKTTKGLVSIRKFICWKTNKEDTDPDYPPYVFCYVDYSPGRKAPLKRVLRIAYDESTVKAIYDEFKEGEIKRGWAPAA